MKVKRVKLSLILMVVFIIIIGFITLIPLLWMIVTSFKTESEASALIPTLLPTSTTLDNYIDLFKQLRFEKYIISSVIVVLLSFMGILVNSFAGFAFEKYEFKGKEILFYIVLTTMMIPAQVTMIPVYLMLNRVGLTNNYLGIVLPGLANGYLIFMYRSFMSTVPNEIMEAARIDGTSELQVFYKIALPVIKPALSIQIVLTFISGWNSFLWPLILSNDERYYTLSVALNIMKNHYIGYFGLQMAGAAIMLLPVIIVFAFFQKNIIDGSVTSGIK
ncbi:carbohydrate ABC transporter permease [Lacrimispora brassicae]